jgi:hypothetical protein
MNRNICCFASRSFFSFMRIPVLRTLLMIAQQQRLVRLAHVDLFSFLLFPSLPGKTNRFTYFPVLCYDPSSARLYSLLDLAAWTDFLTYFFKEGFSYSLLLSASLLFRFRPLLLFVFTAITIPASFFWA